jgi:hypothetical protein
MSYGEYRSVFNKILYETPLPNGDRWNLLTLQNAGLRNTQGWWEMLYRTHGKLVISKHKNHRYIFSFIFSYQCHHGHRWGSSWSMVLFRFRLDVKTGTGRVRMKRFGQRCIFCENDDFYHIGYCHIEEAWWVVQCLLLCIVQKCYERRSEADVDDPYYILPVSDVPSGRFGGSPHRKATCEACFYDRCQEKYRQLTK